MKDLVEFMKGYPYLTAFCCMWFCGAIAAAFSKKPGDAFEAVICGCVLLAIYKAA